MKGDVRTVEWIHLAQDRVQWLAYMNTVPFGFNKSGEFLDWLSG
jgi:hypothetical protein